MTSMQKSFPFIQTGGFHSETREGWMMEPGKHSEGRSAGPRGASWQRYQKGGAQVSSAHQGRIVRPSGGGSREQSWRARCCMRSRSIETATGRAPGPAKRRKRTSRQCQERFSGARWRPSCFGKERSLTRTSAPPEKRLKKGKRKKTHKKGLNQTKGVTEPCQD